jgi:hypothetical protein
MATLLLSGNNEKVSKIMRGVQVTMALASAAVAVYNLAQRQNEIYTTAAAAAQKVYAVAVGTSTGAMKAFRIALLATGIGAAIFALGFLVEKFSSLGDEAEKATNKVSDFTKAIEDDELKALDLKHKRVMHQLKLEGATEGQLQIQYQKNVDEKLALVEKLIKQRKAEGKEAQELYDLSAQLAGEAAESETAYKEQVYEEGKKLREQELKDYYKWLEDKRKLEVTMQENLTKFLQDEEEKRLANLSARRKPREMTEADLAPGVAAVKTAGLIGAPGEGPFDPIAESANNAGDAVVEFATKFRNATRGLKMDIEAQQRKAQELADSWAKAMDQVSQAVSKMANEAVYAFGILMGDLVTGQKDALKVFTSGFIGAIAGFLETFGKSLIEFGVGLQAFKIAIQSMNPAVALVAGAGLVATAQILRNVVQSGVPAFADGGIVSGPTLGLMGEYPGARSNPEVIAPLDKLQSMINTSGSSGELVASTRFDGRDLWLAVNRYEKDKARG